MMYVHEVFFSCYLNLKSSLEAAGKEAPKRSHDGGKAGESDAVDLEGIEPHRGLWGRGRHVNQQAYTRKIANCSSAYTS